MQASSSSYFSEDEATQSDTFVTGATTADDVMQSEYLGHKSKTVLYPILFVLGTVGNILSIIIFANRKMRLVPVYKSFLALAVCDVTILWLFSGSDWIVATFSIDPYDTSQLSCQITTFFRQSIITFNDWWLIVLALVYVITTSSQSYNRTSTWAGAGLAVTLLAIAVGVVVCLQSMYDDICIHIANSLPVQRAVDGLFCLSGLCSATLIVVLLVKLFWRGHSTSRPNSQQSNKTLSAVEATNDEIEEEMEVTNGDDAHHHIVPKAAGVNVTLIVLLSLLLASLIPLILAIVASETEGLSFTLMFTLNENFYDVFISVKVLIYVVTLPDYRRRLLSLITCKCCRRWRRFRINTVAAEVEHQETAMMS